MRRGIIAAAIVAALWVSVVNAAETLTRTYAIPGEQFLTLKLPEAWRDEVSSARGAQGTPLPAIALKPAAGAAFSANMTVRMMIPPGVGRSLDGRLRLLVEQQAGRVAGKIGADPGPPVSIEGARSSGYYFSISEPRFKPGEYQHLTSGVVAVDNVIATFEVLTNDGGEGVMQDMLAVIKSAMVTDSRAGSPRVGRAATLADVTLRSASAAETRVLQGDANLSMDVYMGRSTDVDTVVRMTHPKLVAFAGGEEAVRRNVRDMSRKFQRSGMSIESREFPDPPTIIVTAERSYAIVPTHIVFVAGDKRAESHGFQFGVREPGAATWTYLAGARINAELLDAWFPDFPVDYQFPRISREKL